MNPKQITSLINRIIAPLRQRAALMVSRGVVKLVNDSLKCQGLQVALYADELRSDVERFQDYGLTSVPFADGNAEALYLSIGGNRAHGIVSCVSDRTRRPLDLVEGDVCLYTDKGVRVYLNRVDDILHLGAKVAEAFIARADYTDARVDTIQQAFDAHIHTTTATVGSGTTLGVISTPTSPIGALATVAATKAKVT